MYYERELYHHGIKGQKWGVRRFQNKDGSLTAAGRKRKLELDKAYKYAEDQTRMAKESAKEYSDYKNTKKQYLDSYPVEEWLNDNYGNDWHDPDYMKKVFDVSDVRKHAEKELKNEATAEAERDRYLYKAYKDGEKYWSSKAEQLKNRPISSLSNKEYKEIKKFSKEWDRITSIRKEASSK